MGPVDRDAFLAEHDRAIAARARSRCDHRGPLVRHPDARRLAGLDRWRPGAQDRCQRARPRATGDFDGILFVGLTLLAKDDVATSEAWYSIDGLPWVAFLGADSDGVKVADVLGSAGTYDSTYLGLLSGTCNPPLGPNYLCSAQEPHRLRRILREIRAVPATCKPCSES